MSVGVLDSDAVFVAPVSVVVVDDDTVVCPVIYDACLL